VVVVEGGVLEDVFDVFEAGFLGDSEGHVVVVIVDVLVNLVVDYNLIFFVTDMQEHAGVVPALSFAHEIFAILNSSKQNPQSWVEMVECLH